MARNNNSHTSVTINRTNIVDTILQKSTKDQQAAPATPTIISSTSTLITNTTNDSKYLHKKFKKFCATVDSNTSHNNNNNRGEATVASNVSNVIAGGLLHNNINNNNNSEIVENKNSWSPAQSIANHELLTRSVQHTTNNNSNNNEDLSLRNNNHFVSVPLSPPKHLLTTEEEKQLVKDIIDINNENFMHQSANPLINQSTSSFLITPTPSGSQFVTVTTLGNHNSNFQPTEHRHKISNHQQQQEVLGSFSQTPNGNFVIINNQAPADSSHHHQQPTTTTTTISSTVPTATSGSTPGRYICPYCSLNCAKPSVLQKHIRAHTNERPFPCTLCGFAFKTKSNLYKHCRLVYLHHHHHESWTGSVKINFFSFVSLDLELIFKGVTEKLIRPVHWLRLKTTKTDVPLNPVILTKQIRHNWKR